MNIVLSRALVIAAVVCYAIALAIAAEWVTAAGNARDVWFLLGTLLFAGSFVVD